MKASKATQSFLKHVREICRQYKIKFKVGNGRTVIMKPFGFKALGYFDEYEKILHCAKGRSEEAFLSVLVHEFAHLLQWIEKDNLYTSCNHPKYGSVQNAVCMWVNNELNIRDRELQSYTEKMIDCELNAERRALKLIKQFELPVNIERYSKVASATLFSYWMTKKQRKWDFKITARQMDASGGSLRRSFKSLPKKVESSFTDA